MVVRQATRGGGGNSSTLPAEVYRAKDSKLGRDVAIKVLPDEFSQDKERLARFKREAKVLASLNHPNIASIYGLEQSGDTHYLVLELVEGETLAERIARGSIPADEALPLAIKIAEAVGAAHEQGIIHRDLKPANIKLTLDDIVKILDFGLAKVFGEEAPDADSSMSPTLTRNATRVGVILGTAAYMSPEQAQGKHVDKRTDVWAYACVLYEMLTGRQVFVGEDVPATLARVIEREPDWSLLPRETHALVRRLLRRCLEKDRTERIPDIGIARLDIKEALAAPTTAIHPPASSRTKIVWTASAVILAMAAGLTGWSLARPDRAARPVTRAAILLDEDTRLANLVYPVEGSRLWNTPLALSQDGGTVYFIGEQDGQRRIYRRALGQVEAEPIRGTEGSELVFLSPDGEWLGFSVHGQLKKMRLGEDAPVTFHTGRVDAAAWGPYNKVVFAKNADLWQIDTLGGEPEQMTFDGGYRGQPSFLPGGEALLASKWQGEMMLVPLTTGQPQVLTIGSAPQFVPSGHIVFLRGSSLWAIPFDLDRLEVTGSAMQVLEGVVEQGRVLPNYVLSPSGSLVYVPARGAAPVQ